MKQFIPSARSIPIDDLMVGVVCQNVPYNVLSIIGDAHVPVVIVNDEHRPFVEGRDALSHSVNSVTGS